MTAIEKKTIIKAIKKQNIHWHYHINFDPENIFIRKKNHMLDAVKLGFIV